MKMGKSGFTTTKSSFVNAPITYDTIHYSYYRLGEKVGNAFKDGEKLK